MWDAKMKCTDMQNDVIKFNCLRYSFFSIQEECSMPAFHWICCVAFDFSDSNCIFSIEQRKQRIISSRKTNELPLQFSNILFQAHFKWAISIVIKCKFDWPNDVTLRFQFVWRVSFEFYRESDCDNLNSINIILTKWASISMH